MSDDHWIWIDPVYLESHCRMMDVAIEERDATPWRRFIFRPWQKRRDYRKGRHKPVAEEIMFGGRQSGKDQWAERELARMIAERPDATFYKVGLYGDELAIIQVHPLKEAP